MKCFTFSIIVSSAVILSSLNVTFAQQRARTQNIHQAIINGDSEHVKSLLSGGANINERNRLGGTPLHTAMINGKWEIAELLISKNPDVNVRDKNGKTPLYLAVEKDQQKIVDLLLAKKDIDVNAVTRAGQNALTLAKSKGNTEMTELLLKHGAEEPVLDMEGDMYYGHQAGAPRGNNIAGAATPIQPITPARPTNEPSVLDDPNEIKNRIKTFDGLGKAIKQVTDKSDAEERQWLQNRRDNRTLLSRAVQKQFEDEMVLIKKTAVAEKAKKTVTAIDTLVSQKEERSRKVYRELLQQRREQEQGQAMGRVRSRGRTSSRGGRGRSSMRGGQYGNDMADSYYDSGDMMGGTGRPQRPTRPEEQLDPLTEQEIRLWTQVTPERKNDLSKTVHEQVMAEIGSIRFVAVEEEAKKTTAAIDGLMLARQMRYNQLVLKMEEEEKKALERQQRLEQRYGRSSGRQQDSTQQNMQQRGRSRRR